MKVVKSKSATALNNERSESSNWVATSHIYPDWKCIKDTVASFSV